MKKTSIHLALALVFSFILFGSCKKDDDNNSSDITKENLAGTYKVTKAEYTTSITGTIDYLAYLEDCQKDDTYTLKTDFTGTHNDAGTKCTDPGDEAIEWSLDGNTIIIAGDYAGTIKSFDGKTLTIEGSESEGGITASYSFILVKQ